MPEEIKVDDRVTYNRKNKEVIGIVLKSHVLGYDGVACAIVKLTDGGGLVPLKDLTVVGPMYPYDEANEDLVEDWAWNVYTTDRGWVMDIGKKLLDRLTDDVGHC